MNDAFGSTKLEKLSAQYGDTATIRAIIQAIPYIGGSLDTLLSAAGQKWRVERAEHFFKELDEKLRALSSPPKLKDVASSEELHDLVHFALEQVIRIRSSEKRKKFASIVCRQIAEAPAWDEAEQACRLLADLTDTDLHVLMTAVNAPVCGHPFDGLRVSELPHYKSLSEVTSATAHSPIKLADHLPSLTSAAINISCASLIARGLLHDEGVGRIDTTVMMFVAPTASATWLLTWIKD